MGKNREGSSKNMYKGQVDKAKGGRSEGGRWRWVRLGDVVGAKWRQLYLNDNKKYIKKKA